ncbi:UNC5CL [Branchiostoma lanceolatum]|uniref:Netrin receptor UNC5 n=1 Tax=Branchiostoma lanceolatum TaxID=7740 RepID=A0A8J9ZQQ1_BRALA|nr:UNC5CL [Branchiostoma lanceolatum]
MRTRPVLLLCVFVAVAPQVVRQVTGTTLVLTPDEATAASCTEWEPNADNVTGLATDCSRRNFSAVPSNVSYFVVVLDLAHNRLFFLNRDSFSGLARLKWCTFELQMAEHRHFTTGEKYIIPILLDEVPVNTMPKSLRYLLATKTYIEWKGRGEEEDLFWRRLGKALKSRLLIKRTNNDAIYMEEEATIMPESPTSTPKHRSDTVNEDVEPENNDDHESCVTLDDTPKETRTTDQTIDTTRADEGPCFDNDPPFDCQTVCSSEAYTDNPVVEDVNLTKTVPRSASAAELFLPTVLHESYTEEHAHISCCHEEPIYQNSWFLYHAIRTRAKEPLPPVPDEQLEETSLSIPEPQTTIVHMVAIEHSLSPKPVYEEIPYHGTERGIATYQENVEGIQVVQQPRLNVVTSSLASGIFDSEGGHLDIEGTGVRLFIPPGAIKSSVEQQVTISISSDECDKPTLTEGQARISPVIRCSPHGIAFEKSVALSFPHTGEVSKGKLIHPLITNTDQGQQAGYEDMKEDHGARAIVRKTDCVVFLDHFTGVTLVEESPCPDEGAKGGSGNDGSTDKPLYAIPFWTLTSSGDVMVRVRICQKRDDAKQTAYEEEQSCGSRPCDGPPVTLYVPVTNGTKARVQVVMDSVRAGWASVDGLEKVIDCRRIFTDDEVQQCSFLLERSSDDGHDSNRFRCRLQIIPEGNEDVQTTFVSVLTDESPPPRKQDIAVTPKKTPCLPAWARKELCRLLDPSNPKGNDWRMLSCELNLQLDSFDIQLFQEHSDKRSPTFQILSLFELDYGHLPQVQQLHALRKVLSEPPMGRPDASQLVEGIISQHFEEDAASTPTTRHQHQHCNPVTPNAMSRLTDDRYYSPYAAPCAVHPKHTTRNTLQITDSSIPSDQQDATYCDEAPEEAAMMKNHQQQTVDKQTYKQESQASSTAASRPLKVPGTNARLSLDTDHFENITSQIEDTHSHVDATASTKRMQVTKCDDERITVEEEQVTSPNPVDVPSSVDAPNWTDDKKLKNKHDVVDHDLRKKGLTKRVATMHLSKEEESVSLLDETDA